MSSLSRGAGGRGQRPGVRWDTPLAAQHTHTHQRNIPVCLQSLTASSLSEWRCVCGGEELSLWPLLQGEVLPAGRRPPAWPRPLPRTQARQAPPPAQPSNRSGSGRRRPQEAAAQAGGEEAGPGPRPLSLQVLLQTGDWWTVCFSSSRSPDEGHLLPGVWEGLGNQGVCSVSPPHRSEREQQLSSWLPHRQRNGVC